VIFSNPHSGASDYDISEIQTSVSPIPYAQVLTEILQPRATLKSGFRVENTVLPIRFWQAEIFNWIFMQFYLQNFEIFAVILTKLDN
jgi:hypothetical protein